MHWIKQILVDIIKKRSTAQWPVGCIKGSIQRRDEVSIEGARGLQVR
jgi:hypothetical protein